MTRQHKLSAPQLRKTAETRQETAAKPKTNTDKLRYLSQYDPLTTLPNRAYFRNTLGKALRTAREANKSVAVLFLSVDQYRRINNTLGPAMADRLVRCIAKRLKKITRGSDILGYWGGDKFVLLLECPGNETQVSKIAQDIKKRIGRRYFSFRQEFFLTVSIGIALYPSDGSTVEVLLKNAGTAVFEAQESGGNSYCFFTADLNAIALKHFALENQLGRGLQSRQFTLHYQPQVHTGTWQITGAEALIRWEHPELGSISPSEFIPFAEKSGQIIPIGEWVLRAACPQLNEWHASGSPKLNLAINVSARQFQEPKSVDAILAIFEETGIDPDCLELELTESLLMTSSQQVIKSLSKLKDMGVKLAIDDFGTGFSSLEYLRRLPLDTLKIAPSFVHDISKADGAALVSSIIDLAQKLRLRVMAEGVETKKQMKFLQQLGCYNMQGYLFGKPLPGEEFKTLMARPNYKFEERNKFVHLRAAS